MSRKIPVPYNPFIPAYLAKHTVFLPADGRTMATFVCSTKGSGKSRYIGRVHIPQDILSRTPLVAITPVTGLIENVLDKCCYLPDPVFAECWSRIHYINMAGQPADHSGDRLIIPFPIYQRTNPTESFYDITKPFVDVIRRVDPALSAASIQGMNRLLPILLSSGIIIAALGLGIREAYSLVSDPKEWEPRIIEVAAAYPTYIDVQEAAADLLDLAQLQAKQPREFEIRTEVYRNKLAPFRFNPVMAAIFNGSSDKAISWDEVESKQLAVLIDLKDIDDAEDKRFCYFWIFHSLMRWMKKRGKHAIPFSLVIDELSECVGSVELNAEIFASDLDALLNRYARNNSVQVTLMAQELHQFQDPKIQHTLLSCGNLILGSTTNKETALLFARRFFRPDLYKIKEQLPVYGSDRGDYFELDRRNVYFTPDEQDELNSRKFLDLPTFQFYLGVSPREGTPPTSLQRFSIEALDRGIYPDPERIEAIQHGLMRRDGVRHSEVLPSRPVSPGHTVGQHPAPKIKHAVKVVG
ncbi:hypothetical protein [Nitrolancea hollandica]|nr:hypothetical protein [Nitrolancea hollandica]